MCASEYVIYLILLYNNKITRRFQMKQKKTKNNTKKIE